MGRTCHDYLSAGEEALEDSEMTAPTTELKDRGTKLQSSCAVWALEK